MIQHMLECLKMFGYYILAFLWAYVSHENKYLKNSDKFRLKKKHYVKLNIQHSSGEIRKLDNQTIGSKRTTTRILIQSETVLLLARKEREYLHT